ncbi:MAG: hypothetical protein K2X27_22860, partial [Candidatus Obscuribacterales bacterium]|nr:hypothetical protein [Candidatus Obscuribacterales bacterium]
MCQKCPPEDSSEYDLVISSGGATAVLAGVGAALGCAAAGIYKFRRVGGVSGGSIFASLLASGLCARQLLK